VELMLVLSALLTAIMNLLRPWSGGADYKAEKAEAEAAGRRAAERERNWYGPR
jgi:hypothetical protein